MQDWLCALAYLVMTIAAWFAPIAFFAVAGFVAYSASGGNERASNAIMWLFIAVGLLLMVPLYYTGF